MLFVLVRRLTDNWEMPDIFAECKQVGWAMHTTSGSPSHNCADQLPIRKPAFRVFIRLWSAKNAGVFLCLDAAIVLVVGTAYPSCLMNAPFR
jgi:hypothetical protein